MAIVFEMREGDALSIGGAAIVSIIEKRGRKTKVSVEADRGVKVARLVQPPSMGEVVANKGVVSIKS